MPVRILHLEDVPDDAELVRHTLAQAPIDCQVTWVDSRGTFLAALEKDEFDLVIADYSLPGFDGAAALRLLRERRPELPFIVLSGTVGEEHAIGMLQAGATDYVLKQRLSRLAPAVSRALREAEENAKRRRAEEALRQSQERFALVARAITDALWDWDLATDRVWWSEGVQLLFGYSEEQIGSTLDWWRDLIHPGDRERVVEHLQAALEGGGSSLSFEYRFRRADGSYAAVLDRAFVLRDESGKARRMLGSMVDLTERRRAEEQIREQAALLDKARDAIVVSDLEGRIGFWSQGAERIYGWPAGEALGCEATRLFQGDSSAAREAWRRVLASGEWVGELSRERKDARRIIVESRWTLVRDDAGQPRSVLTIDTDVTEKKQFEVQLLRAQRMESIGTLAGGIAHDLNNVLSPILLAVEILGRRVSDERGRRMLATIEASAQRGADMVKQVLTFARGVEGERAVLQPRHVIKEIEKIIAEAFPKTIQLRSDLAADLWRITGDATQVHQVLLNLCVNARDAMPHGGILTLKAENVTLDEHFAALHLDARPGPCVVLSVTDTGSGIPEALRERVFEPFFTTKEAGKGTGLGLSTTQAIVKSHGGFMSLYSELGRGTTFKVFLPVASLESAMPPVERMAALPAGNGEVVLVVDDEAAIREITQETLEANGYQVLTAAEGAEAVALFVSRRIDAVVTDMTMPLMDGQATIRALRRINPAIKIIATSGFVPHGSMEHGEGVAQAFLVKPYTAERLLTTLHSVLAGEEPRR